MPAYNASRHDPPAPLAVVAVRNPQSGAQVDHIDFGESNSAMPLCCRGRPLTAFSYLHCRMCSMN